MILLPENVNLSIEQVAVDDGVTVTLGSKVLTAMCPTCGHVSKRVHSRYQRKPSDLPVSGRPVRLVIKVRRFFCGHACCPCKTFAERMPSLVRPHAQRTVRLQEALQQLGLALGGEAGARLSTQFGVPSSPDSLLRLVRQIELPVQPPAKIIGIDDWAYKRRLRYGTLICDLETRRPIDLLPDRSVQTVCSWLEQHPEVEMISRDRWSEYASAAQKGAPQAVQIADRCHLLTNLVESLSAVLARNRSQISQASFPTGTQAVSAPLTQRQDQYTHSQRLQQQGLSPVQIASRIGLSERTIYRWIELEAAPSGHHLSRSRSVMDPYKAYVRKRWQEGCRKGSQLCKELKTLGYRYLTFLQATLKPAEQTITSVAAPQEPFSAKQAVWLLIRQPEELNEQQRQELVRICQASPQIEKAYQLAQSFRGMLRQRQGEERLNGWLQDAVSCGVPELRQFAAGIQRDKAAVQAGLSLPYSTGPVEGHINRLKLIKRSMYGRANVDLLRQRELCAS